MQCLSVNCHTKFLVRNIRKFSYFLFSIYMYQRSPFLFLSLPLFLFNHFSIAHVSDIPYGLAVRIPGFHPGGPGSTPGMGTHFFSVRT